MTGTMARWDPFGDLAELRSRLDQAFGDLGRPGRTWAPAIDVIRGEEQLTVRADVPGVKPEDITVEVENGVLTVAGEHEERSEEREQDYVRRERRYGSFSRSLMLPEGTDPAAISAVTKDGVLEVTIPLPKGGGEKVTITPKAEAAS